MTKRDKQMLAEDFYKYLTKEKLLGTWKRDDLDAKYQEFRLLKKGFVLELFCISYPEVDHVMQLEEPMK